MRGCVLDKSLLYDLHHVLYSNMKLELGAPWPLLQLPGHITLLQAVQHWLYGDRNYQFGFGQIRFIFSLTNNRISLFHSSMRVLPGERRAWQGVARMLLPWFDCCGLWVLMEHRAGLGCGLVESREL